MKVPKKRNGLKTRLCVYCGFLGVLIGICYFVLRTNSGDDDDDVKSTRAPFEYIQRDMFKNDPGKQEYLMFTNDPGKQEYLDVQETPMAETFIWRDDKQRRFSAHSCYGSHMQKYAWMTTSCELRNACFNITSKEILYYKAPNDDDPPTVSITVVNYRWGLMYDESIKFSPRIIEGPLPPGHWHASSDDLYIFHLCHVPQNPGHLLWDDYWTWFMTTAATNSLAESRNIRIHPIWYNVPKNPPWATCDWVWQHSGPGHRLTTQHAAQCYKINSKWLRTFLGPGHVSPPQTQKWLTEREDILAKSDLVCFPRALVGSGATSRNMGGHDGWVPDDVLPPTAGRAPLIESFRNHIIKRALGHREKTHLPRMLIYVAQHSSLRINWDMKFHINTLEENLPMLRDLAREVSGIDSLRVDIEAGMLSKLSATDQIRKMVETSIYLGVAGGGAMSAQFLPRGAGLVLYHAPQDHQGKDDWKIFGMYSPIRVDFLPSDEKENQTLLVNTIARHVVACAMFMRYDAQNNQ